MDLSIGVDPERLASALKWANESYADCRICPEDCGVDRHEGELGLCGLGADARVYKEYLHLGEEEALVPSHTIYLSGCNFRCAFCSDMGPVKNPKLHGLALDPANLSRRIAKRRAEGATNVNFVGGLPDVNVLYILRTLTHCPEDTHVVFNTNLWTTEEAVGVLEGVVGTWLVDFKFGADRCARKLAGIDNYVGHMQRLLPRVSASANLLIRHLLMPGHVDCCTRPVFEWLSSHLPEALVNVMTGYKPFQLALSKSRMGGGLDPSEVDAALALARATGLRYIVDGRSGGAV